MEEVEGGAAKGDLVGLRSVPPPGRPGCFLEVDVVLRTTEARTPRRGRTTDGLDGEVCDRFGLGPIEDGGDEVRLLFLLHVVVVVVVLQFVIVWLRGPIATSGRDPRGEGVGERGDPFRRFVDLESGGEGLGEGVAIFPEGDKGRGPPVGRHGEQINEDLSWGLGCGSQVNGRPIAKGPAPSRGTGNDTGIVAAIIREGPLPAVDLNSRMIRAHGPGTDEREVVHM